MAFLWTTYAPCTIDQNISDVYLTDEVSKFIFNTKILIWITIVEIFKKFPFIRKDDFSTSKHYIIINIKLHLFRKTIYIHLLYHTSMYNDQSLQCSGIMPILPKRSRGSIKYTNHCTCFSDYTFKWTCIECLVRHYICIDCSDSW